MFVGGTNPLHGGPRVQKVEGTGPLQSNGCCAYATHTERLTDRQTDRQSTSSGLGPA